MQLNDQMAVQQLLQTRLDTIRSKNGRYSLRAFSKKVGLQPSALSEILNGKRRVSKKFVLRLAERLSLDPQERAELLAHFPERASLSSLKNGEVQNAVAPKYTQISVDEFKLISDWYHFAILSLLGTAEFKSNPTWIADRLGLTVSVVRQAISRLKRLKIVAQRPEGRLVRIAKRIRTSDDVVNLSVRRAHLQYLECAREALEQVPVELRDFTSIVFPVDPLQLPRAKSLIRKFQDDMGEVLERNPKTEVYQLCVQLFPLTRTQNKREKK